MQQIIKWHEMNVLWLAEMMSVCFWIEEWYHCQVDPLQYKEQNVIMNKTQSIAVHGNSYQATGMYKQTFITSCSHLWLLLFDWHGSALHQQWSGVNKGWDRVANSASNFQKGTTSLERIPFYHFYLHRKPPTPAALQTQWECTSGHG